MRRSLANPGHAAAGRPLLVGDVLEVEGVLGVGREDLEGNFFAQAAVLGETDFAHTPLGQSSLDFLKRDGLADHASSCLDPLHSP